MATFVLLGSLFTVAVDATTEARRSAEPRRAQLIELITERHGEIDRLEEDVALVRRQLRTAESQLSRHAHEAAADRRRVRLLSGLVPLEGPGVRVVLTDSDLATTDPARSRRFRILDIDLQLVTNALWASGAEAVAINGRRLVTLTSIRGAGRTITVNFRPIAPPYEVIAIGAEMEAFRDTGVAERLENWSHLFGFGFGVTEERGLHVPAYSGSTRLVAARTVVEVEE